MMDLKLLVPFTIPFEALIMAVRYNPCKQQGRTLMKTLTKVATLTFALLGTASLAAVTTMNASSSTSSAAASGSFVTIPAMPNEASSSQVVTLPTPLGMEYSSSTPAISGSGAAHHAPVPALTAAAGKALPGINISGGEFGKVPGRVGYDYNYPKNSDIDYFASKGFKLIRIPFRWQRLQPDLFGPLSAPDRTALNKAVLYANSKGLTVALDMHDYSARLVNARAARVGTAELPASALTDVWTRIGEDYKGNDKVWIGIMNEPSGIAISDWWKVAQEVTNALRSKAINNKLLVPGGSWSGAHSWLKSGNSSYAEKFRDPKGNFAFEVHQYFDKDSSGTQPQCVAGSGKRLGAALDWAQRNDVKLFVGELAGSGDAQCAIEYGEALSALNASSNVIGWAAWGGGAWWAKAYMFRLNPIAIGGPETAHMALLTKSLSAQ
tara:strand:- start:9021 stop:10331 length:1311 start_codon:yes stop_codon:yes gene_type:complete